MQTLTLIDKAFLLKRYRLFQELDLDLLLAIADKIGVAYFETGKKIFSVHEEAQRMYFIIEGEVAISDAQGSLLATLGPDEFFGEESLFNEKPRGYEAKCKASTHLLTLTQMSLMAIISECPLVAIGLLSVYTSSLKFRVR